jgi:hypothetical protein
MSKPATNQSISKPLIAALLFAPAAAGEGIETIPATAQAVLMAQRDGISEDAAAKMRQLKKGADEKVARAVESKLAKNQQQIKAEKEARFRALRQQMQASRGAGVDATERKRLQEMARTQARGKTATESAIHQSVREKSDARLKEKVARVFADRCARCEKPGVASPLQACSRCREVSYCGKECQRAHWSQHRPDCHPAGAGAGAGTSAPTVPLVIPKKTGVSPTAAERKATFLRIAGGLIGNTYSSMLAIRELRGQLPEKDHTAIDNGLKELEDCYERLVAVYLAARDEERFISNSDYNRLNDRVGDACEVAISLDRDGFLRSFSQEQIATRLTLVSKVVSRRLGQLFLTAYTPESETTMRRLYQKAQKQAVR